MNKFEATEALQAIANPRLQAYQKMLSKEVDKLSPSTFNLPTFNPSNPSMTDR
jgi:hypothetical protein